MLQGQRRSETLLWTLSSWTSEQRGVGAVWAGCGMNWGNVAQVAWGSHLHCVLD